MAADCFRCLSVDGASVPSTIDVVNDNGEVVMALCNTCAGAIKSAPGQRIQERLFPEVGGAGKVRNIADGRKKLEEKRELNRMAADSYIKGAKMTLSALHGELIKQSLLLPDDDMRTRLHLSLAIENTNKLVQRILEAQISQWEKITL